MDIGKDGEWVVVVVVLQLTYHKIKVAKKKRLQIVAHLFLAIFVSVAFNFS